MDCIGSKNVGKPYNAAANAYHPCACLASGRFDLLKYKTIQCIE